jgi:hypothetical protein
MKEVLTRGTVPAYFFRLEEIQRDFSQRGGLGHEEGFRHDGIDTDF